MIVFCKRKCYNKIPPKKNGKGKGAVNEIVIFLFSENMVGYGNNAEVI